MSAEVIQETLTLNAPQLGIRQVEVKDETPFSTAGPCLVECQ